MSTSRPLLGEYVPPDDTDELRRKNFKLEEELRQTRVELTKALKASDKFVLPMRHLRKVLNPLYRALREIYEEGELESVGPDRDDPSVAVAPRASAVWERWMNQLGGNRAAVLKALLEHGEMSRVQLRVASAVPDGSLNSVTSELHKLGLINRGGGKYSLKEL